MSLNLSIWLSLYYQKVRGDVAVWILLGPFKKKKKPHTLKSTFWELLMFGLQFFTKKFLRISWINFSIMFLHHIHQIVPLYFFTKTLKNNNTSGMFKPSLCIANIHSFHAISNPDYWTVFQTRSIEMVQAFQEIWRIIRVKKFLDLLTNINGSYLVLDGTY